MKKERLTLRERKVEAVEQALRDLMSALIGAAAARHGLLHATYEGEFEREIKNLAAAIHR